MPPLKQTQCRTVLVLSIKSECLSKLILFGEKSLRRNSSHITTRNARIKEETIRYSFLLHRSEARALCNAENAGVACCGSTTAMPHSQNDLVSPGTDEAFLQRPLLCTREHHSMFAHISPTEAPPESPRLQSSFNRGSYRFITRYCGHTTIVPIAAWIGRHNSATPAWPASSRPG